MMALLVELREFLSVIQFARPNALGLLLVPLLYAIVRRGATRRDRGRWTALGRPGTLAALRTSTGARPALTRIAAVLAWAALAVAVAGPRWGTEDERGIAVGRDYLLVLDFSRSMWAEDMADRQRPARWQAAVAAARDLVDELRARGGNRVALVVFAARPAVLVPLTTDYDHVSFRLEELDATTPPAEIRPADDAAASGTRIGAALAMAVASHDPRFPGFQEIVLVTDGDDPANDGEWRTGAVLARNAGIPIHAVGVGDPASDSFLFHRGGPLESTDANGIRTPIQTRLHEDVVETLAKDSQGAYLASRRTMPAMRDFLNDRIVANATRELDDERRPQPRERSAVFVLPALVLLAFVWWRGR